MLNIRSLFKRKVEPEPVLPDWWDTWMLLQRLYPVGSRVEYLGKVMIVSRHVQYEKARTIGGDVFGMRTYMLPTIYPAIVVEYLDVNDIIRTKTFRLYEWDWLLKAKGVIG